MVSCRVVVGNGSLEVMVRYKVKFLWGKGYGVGGYMIYRIG